MCVGGAVDKFQANHPFPSAAHLKKHNLDQPATLTSRGEPPAKGKTRIRACCSSGAIIAILEPSGARVCERLRVDAQELWAPPFQGSKA